MLLNKGELDGKRLLSPRAVELMASVHIPDTLPGRQPGEGWGLGVRVISDNAFRNTWLSNGSFGWTGASGTHFWIDPEKHLVGILMAHAGGRTPARLRGRGHAGRHEVMMRGDELRTYNLSIAGGVELWRVTECPGQPTHPLKEADLASIDELFELLEEIGRSLRAAGWRESSESA